MKVQVTKDSWGVSIWFEDIELSYSAPSFKKPSTMVGKEPVWINDKITWFKKQKPFSDKFVKKNFPELDSMLKIGDKVIMDLVVVQQK
jgi:hypothetical protein